MQNYVQFMYIVIHDVAGRVMIFAKNTIGLEVTWINSSLVIKFNFKISMGMDNPVTCLTIK